MRLLALLLSLYVLCLSCMPCMDGTQVRVEQGQTSLRAASDSKSEHHANDQCSPLCQCQCCASVAVTALGTGPSLRSVPAVSWPVSLRHAPLLVGATTHAAGAVWQPPKV